MLAQAYAKTYRTNAVLTASPGHLVLMLYDAALKNMALARQAFEMPEGPQRISAINTHLQKAQAIIHELNSGLDFGPGGEFASTMTRLYDYHNRRLLEANMKKTAEPIIEVERLVGELRTAWAEMLAKPGATAPGTRGAGA